MENDEDIKKMPLIMEYAMTNPEKLKELLAQIIQKVVSRVRKEKRKREGRKSKIPPNYPQNFEKKTCDYTIVVSLFLLLLRHGNGADSFHFYLAHKNAKLLLYMRDLRSLSHSNLRGIIPLDLHNLA